MAEQTQRCSIDNNNIFCFVNEARHVKDMVMVINLQKQPKMILENPIKSQISNFQKRIPKYSRYYQKIPQKLSLIFLEIFQKDLFVLKYERYHLDLEIVEDICRHLYVYT